MHSINLSLISADWWFIWTKLSGLLAMDIIICNLGWAVAEKDSETSFMFQIVSVHVIIWINIFLDKFGALKYES